MLFYRTGQRKEFRAFDISQGSSTSTCPPPLGPLFPSSGPSLTNGSLFLEDMVQVWRAAFLSSDPPPVLCQLPFAGGLQGIVCVGRGSAFPFSPCSHPSSELCCLIPSSWFCCLNKWECFLNVAQRCLQAANHGTPLATVGSVWSERLVCAPA